MTASAKRLSIILPSFNDARIDEAIDSVRRFDDIGTVRLVIVDGGSRQDVLDIIKSKITPDDYFVSEPDKGIFDGLNKGLEACDTEFIGWLGSDDVFTCQVRASDVVAGLANHDFYIGNMALFRDERIRRVTFAYPTKLGLDHLGLHNPHYASFGRASLYKSERFRLDLLGADIEYFLRLTAKKPRIATVGVIATLMREGGHSSKSSRRIIDVNLQLMSMYAARSNVVVGAVAVAVKVVYKMLSAAYFNVVRIERRSLEV